MRLVVGSQRIIAVEPDQDSNTMTRNFESLLMGAILGLVAIAGKELESIPADCKTLLEELGTALRSFDKCALDNSRPFTVCRQCASVYEQTHNLFSDVIQLRSPLSEKCRTLVEDGKISLVKVMFEHIENIWNDDGVCGDCFDPDSYNISSQVIEFFELRDRLQTCFDKTWDFNTTCDLCDSEFRNLTNYFTDVLHAETYKGHCLCLDILDAMNQTRATWGDRCYSPREKLNIKVVLVAATSFVITVAFYVTSRLAQSPKDIGLARVNTLQSNMFEEGCECGAAHNEPCGCHGKHINEVEGYIVQ